MIDSNLPNPKYFILSIMKKWFLILSNSWIFNSLAGSIFLKWTNHIGDELIVITWLWFMEKLGQLDEAIKYYDKVI